MPRDHARVNVSIWGDPEWRQLPPAAQHLYLTLWTSPTLTYCGTHDWRPARITGLTKGWTREHIETVAACLHARHFLVIDDETEEVFIRSWMRFDGLLKQPRMAISCVTAYDAVASEKIRPAIVWELERIREENPDLSCWGDKRVAEVLSHPSVSAKDMPVPDDPFRDGFTPQASPGLALGLPQTQGEVSPSVYTPPTPSPTPSPYSISPDDSDRKRSPRGSRIPDDFSITDDMRAWAAEHTPDIDIDYLLPEFVDYWRGVAGQKGVKLNWVSTWRNGMRKRQEWAKENKPTNGQAGAISPWDKQYARGPE